MGHERIDYRHLLLPSASVTYQRPASSLENGAFIDDNDAAGDGNDDGLVVDGKEVQTKLKRDQICILCTRI